MSKQDLINQKFNRLLVISKDIKKNKKHTYWICKCECGNIKSIRGYDLVYGVIKSCGCLNRETQQYFENLTGHVFHYWKVLSHETAKYCQCECKCGNIKTVKVQSLRDETSKSCGCYKTLVAKNQIININKRKKIERGLDPNITLSTNNEVIRHKLKPLFKLILGRDKFTCNLCGQIGGKLNVHHIEKFSSNISKRSTPSNLITLCEQCHKKAHDNNFNNGLNYQIQELLKTIVLTKEEVLVPLPLAEALQT